VILVQRNSDIQQLYYTTLFINMQVWNFQISLSLLIDLEFRFSKKIDLEFLISQQVVADDETLQKQQHMRRVSRDTKGRFGCTASILAG